MKSFANARIGMVTIVGALTITLGLMGPVSTARAQEQPPGQDDAARGAAALAAGRAALQANRWQDAIDRYTEALQYLPGNEEAMDGIQQARTQLDEGDTIPGVAETADVQRQRALAEFSASMELARQRLGNGEFEGATQALAEARVLLSRRQTVLSENEFRDLMNESDELLAGVDQARETDRLRREEEARQRALEEQRLREQQAREARQAIIDQNLERVRQLQMELKYTEALQVIDEILFQDELNPGALALRDIIMTTMMFREYSEIQRLKELGFSQAQTEVQRSMILPRPNISGPGNRSTSGLMDYPVDWPQLSIRRGGEGGFQESEQNRMVRRQIQDNRFPLNFNQNSFEQVITFLEQVSGVNIYVDWRALNNAGIDREDEVTLDLQEVNTQTALDRIMEQLGDGGDQPQWTIQDGMVTVSSDEQIRSKTELRVYDIRDLLFQVPIFSNAPDIDLDSALDQGNNQGGGGGSGGGGGGGGGGGFGGGGGGGSGGGGNIFGESGEDPERPSREELVDQIVNIIQDNVDPEGWRDLGGDTGSLQELNGNLIITNTPNNHLQIEGLLSQLREIRALQINVESRFLTVASDWFEKIGVDLDLFFNTNDDMWQAAQAIDPNAHLSDFFNPDGSLKDPVVFGSFAQVADTDPLTPFNTVPTGAIIGVPNAAGTDTDLLIGPTGSPIRATDGFAPISFNQQHLGLLDSLAEFDAASFAGIANANPALAVGIQFLDDIQVDLLIEATQADRRSVVLTAPRLTFFNGQRSWVAVTTQQAFVASLTAVTGDASGAFQPNIQTLTDGFVLDVEAVISADRRYVTLTVIFDFAEFLGFRQSSAAEFGGAAGGGGVTGGTATDFTGAVELPILRVSQIRTTVSVPDKGTVLLGGQRSVREIDVETGVPVLSKIPFVNRFFTNRVSSKEEQTLLILIRPEIIIQQENEDLLFPGLTDSLGGAGSYLR